MTHNALVILYGPIAIGTKTPCTWYRHCGRGDSHLDLDLATHKQLDLDLDLDLEVKLDLDLDLGLDLDLDWELDRHLDLDLSGSGSGFGFESGSAGHDLNRVMATEDGSLRGARRFHRSLRRARGVVALSQSRTARASSSTSQRRHGR